MAFNCAAPFRERLVLRHFEQITMMGELQLCRPLSGAVRTPDGAAPTGSSARFNCAAPFRERLAACSTAENGWDSTLQLCRPLSGAVSWSDGRRRLR